MLFLSLLAAVFVLLRDLLRAQQPIALIVHLVGNTSLIRCTLEFGIGEELGVVEDSWVHDSAIQLQRHVILDRPVARLHRAIKIFSQFNALLVHHARSLPQHTLLFQLLFIDLFLLFNAGCDGHLILVQELLLCHRHARFRTRTLHLLLILGSLGLRGCLAQP